MQTWSLKGVIKININDIWAKHTASVLQRLGVKYACISPGNRNSHLTSAFTSQSDIKCTSHIDERSAGFFALGLAKYSKSPVVLICTSGTAPANYYPAVIEANLNRVPLIILSADRPEVLIGTGSNQTINQQDLFGYQVRMFRDVGLPETNFGNLTQSLTKAYNQSRGFDAFGKSTNPAGPVHLNFPFDLGDNRKLGAKTSELLEITNPVPRTQQSVPFIQNLPNHSKPLIICGGMDDVSNRIPILKLASAIKSPVLADPSSQIRYGMESPNIITGYNLFLKYSQIEPDFVLRFGAKPTSKILCKLMDDWNEKSILIDPTGRFNDDCPTVLQVGIKEFCEHQTRQFQDKSVNSVWLEKILSLENSVQSTLLNDPLLNQLFEGSIAQTCVSAIPSGSNFFIGNSMPVRDVDSFTPNSGKEVRVFVNRGASGIDGIISTASGIASKSNTKNNLLLIGDLSFYHDMNGLLSSKRNEIDLTIVVVNNNGGGIFSFLSISENSEKQFDTFWTTPHGLDFRKIAEVYGCKYSQAKCVSELYDTITNSFNSKGVKVIEVQIDISENVKCHRKILENLSCKLKLTN